MVAIKIEENGQGYSPKINNFYKGSFLIQKGPSSSGKYYPKISEWTLLENAKYVAFIEQNYERMNSKPHTKLWTLYQ